MAKDPCHICAKKTTKICGACEAATCRSCAHDIGDNYFKYWNDVSEDLQKGYYCNDCFVGNVSESFEKYNEILDRAKDMEVYFKKKHSKEIRFFAKSKVQVFVEDAEDYDDMILNLAFQAAEQGYNTIIQVEEQSKKVHDASYKHLLWSGSGIPANKSFRS